MAKLLVMSSAPATMVDGMPYLDIKFVEGMKRYAEIWDGTVDCTVRQIGKTFSYGDRYDRESFPFGVNHVPVGWEAGEKDISDYDVVLCGADNDNNLHMAELCKKSQKMVFIIEHIPETWRRIIRLYEGRGVLRKLHGLRKTVLNERRHRRAFRLADGIQANGYPAYKEYRPLNENVLMHLDNRIESGALATPENMQARAERLRRGDPIRIIHSGRLEPLKGSQDLAYIAKALRDSGVNFTLDIFGSGSLEEKIKDDVGAYGLEDHVRLNGSVDFETELVPFAKECADIYLSCHRQSDPSCTYLESMGCGLAVFGYDNRMWSALAEETRAGWVAPMGKREALAECLSKAAKDREALIGYCHNALGFAERHTFETEFQKRMSHLMASL